MSGHLLTLNAGSSSLKFALFDRDRLDRLAIGQIDGLGSDPALTIRDGAGAMLVRQSLDARDGPVVSDQASALPYMLAEIARLFPTARIEAVGHRIVHGGTRFCTPVILDATIEAALAALNPLAPLHQPHNLAGVRAARAAFPDAVQVGCFDTAFHRAQPFVSDVFALPRVFYDEGVRRYGFHGLSYEAATAHLERIAPHHAAGRVIVCHLGSGASMCAMHAGHAVASTMGFSALDGLPMGTRPGQLDPGVLLYLLQHKGMTVEAIADLLYRHSGLKGLSGLSGDMRVLLASDTREARQAVDHFVFRARRELGGLAAVLEGLDAIVFTGGIGENAWPVREAILEAMEWLGVELDPDRNRAGETVISSERSRVRVFIIPCDEEGVIARHTATLLA